VAGQPRKIWVVADTSPTWTFRVRRNNEAFNGTGWTLSLLCKLSDATTFTKTPTWSDAVGGIATVTFASTDLDVVGKATADLKLTNGGNVQHARRPFIFYIRAEHEDPEL
jgi:hypothetical protein